MTESAEVLSLAEALIEANDLLLGLYDLADVTSQSLDEREMVEHILRRAVRIVHANALVLVTPTSRVGVGSPADQQRLDRGGSDQATTRVTATHGNGLFGELRAIRDDTIFSTGDRKLLSAVLRTTLSAIETARLHRQAIDAALDARDHQRAAEVAQLALPRHQPRLDDVDVFFETDQAKETGGDLVCFVVDGDRLSFAVGDVSGKGLPAAVMMTTAVCATQAAFRDPGLETPGAQLRRVNEWMFDHLAEAGLFITMFIGHYRRRDDRLEWANAGHSPCLVATVDGAEDLAPLTPPLGILSDIGEASGTTALASGDVVLIGSDGIVEQPSLSGEAFGESRLHDVLAANRDNLADVTGSRLLRAVNSFAGGGQQSDDRTVVVLRHDRTPSA